MEDRELIQAWQDHRDESAIRELIARYINAMVGKQWFDDDLKQEMRLAIVNAADHFDLSKENAFYTLAVHYRKEVRNRLYFHDRFPVHIPCTRLSRLTPEYQEARKEAVHRGYHQVFLDDMTPDARDRVLGPEEGPTPEDKVLQKHDFHVVAECLHCLTPRQRKAFQLFADDPDATLDVHAGVMGVSRERVRQLREVAFEKVAKALGGR